MQRSDTELARAHSVIVSEFETLERTYSLYNMLKLQDGNLEFLGSHYDIQCVFNDLLVLFIVHARKLAGFFSARDNQSDDIKLSDFGFDKSYYALFESSQLSILYKRASKEVLHLTYKQIADMKQREWDADGIFSLLKERFEIYIDLMNTQKNEIVLKSLDLDRLFILQN